jgi:hypothetical protein
VPGSVVWQAGHPLDFLLRLQFAELPEIGDGFLVIYLSSLFVDQVH